MPRALYPNPSWESTLLQGVDRATVAACRRYAATLTERVRAGEGLWIMGAPEHRNRGAMKRRSRARNLIAALIADTATGLGLSAAYYDPDRLFACLLEARTDGIDLMASLKTIDLLVLVNLDWNTVAARVSDKEAAERMKAEQWDQQNPPYTAHTSGWAQSQFYDLLNTRYEESRSMVVTTRMLDLTRVQEHVGQNIASQLFETCIDVPLRDWDPADINQPIGGEPDG